MRRYLFHVEAAAFYRSDGVPVEVAATRQSYPDGGEPVLKLGDDAIPNAYVLQ